MRYCTVQDVEAYYLNKSFKCGDYLTNGKAEDFIICDASIINAIIRTRYSLPITDDDDLRILKSINEKMVVGTIDDIFREKTAEGEFDRGRNTRKEALKMLDDIKNGVITLNSRSKTSTIKFNSVNSDGNEVTKRFKESHIDTD